MDGDLKPQRILMTCDAVGGVWTYALELTRALATYGIEVALAVMGGTLPPDRRDEAREVGNLTVMESGYKLEWMQDPWEDVRRAGEWLLELERDFEPDAVHLNGYVHGALPWRAPVLMVGHSCVLSWWSAVRGADAPESWARYRREVMRGLRAADLVVAPTRAMLAALGRHYGIREKGRVIPNGRTAACFPSAEKEPFVLTAGRLWDEAKNVHVFERITPRLQWPVFAAGEDVHPQGGRMTCSRLCLLGQLSARELSQWYARAAIYALPARYEPFGLTPLEAALAGCALVLGDIPSLRETWGDAALFVSPDDSARLRQALQCLIDTPSEREILAARARSRACELTPERMAHGYLQAYRELGKTVKR